MDAPDNANSRTANELWKEPATGVLAGLVLAITGIAVSISSVLAVHLWEESGEVTGTAIVVALNVVLCIASALLVARIRKGERAASERARTAMQRLEAAKASAERLALVARRTTNAIVITDTQRRIEWVNEGFERLTGYTLEEVKGRTPGGMLQCEHTNSDTIRRMREELSTKSAFRGELLNRRKNGEEYWVDVDIQALLDESGRHCGYMAIETDITQFVKQRGALEESESRFRALVETAEVMVWEYSLDDDRFTYVSPAAAKFGYPMDWWLKPGFWASKVHPEDVERATEECVRDTEAGIPHRLVYRMLTATGDIRWISDYVSAPETTAKGRFVRGAAVDITERKRFEEALQEESERASLALAGASLGSWDWNVQTGAVTVDQRWAEMLGLQPSDLTGTLQDWSERLHPDDREACEAALQAHWRGETPRFRQIHRLRHANGTYLTVNGYGRLMSRDAAGRPLRMVGVNQDITEEVASHAALEHREAALSRTSHIARVGWWEMSTEDKLPIWSDEVKNIHEVEPDFQPTLESAISFYAPEARASIQAAVEAAIARQQAWDFELPFISAKGRHLWVRAQGEPVVKNDKVVRLVGAFQDITELVKAREEALTASRVKSQFLANMSHEIRTPMTAILGYADLLANYGDRDAAPRQRLEYIDTIRRNGESLLAIINDILDISKIEAGRMTIEHVPTSIEAIVDETVTLLSPQAARKGLRLEASYDTDVPSSILTDPVRFRQILVNLVGNAVKFTEAGYVTVRIRYTATPVAQLSCEIRDTGIGISQEHIETIFEPFAQGDCSMTRRFGGTGLGLQISRRLADMLGGSITVRSELGRGSTFTLSVAAPLAEGAQFVRPDVAHASIQAMRHVAPPSLGTGTELAGVRVLLAEDGADNARLITFFLRKAGAEVRAVSNGRALVEVLTVDNTIEGDLGHADCFDLILTDMQMPEMDGYAAVRLLRQKGCGLPIIAITAHAMSDDAEKCKASGCDFYLSKPINRAEMISLCARAAGKGAAA